MDFCTIKERSRRGGVEIYPDFRVADLEDLLIRGGKFYAVWDEEKELWSQNPLTARRIVDKALWDHAEKFKKDNRFDGPVNILTMESDSSGSWNRFTAYLKRFPDCDIQLDSKLTFQNSVVKKEDYVSKRLGYSLEEGDYSAWDKMVGTLYDDGEREKIEWAIGAVISGDSKTIQKFCVFYGDPGTGKGTIIEILMKLFKGYYTVFDAKALGSASDQFSTEMFASNPLVALQTDGDLSRIEDNTKLNSIISHEPIVINEKNKSRYMGRANCFMFLGTNKPVKITDARSGIIRRLIDINPSGRTIKTDEYEALMSQIDFQLGGIAWHCLKVYRELGKNYYKNYKPRQMIMKTDVFYNFVDATRDIFEEQDGVTLKQAYAIYKDYCDDALVEFKLPKYKFREELKAYFEHYDERARDADGNQVRNWFSGFKKEKLDPPVLKKEPKPFAMVLEYSESLLDDILKDCKAQYAGEDEKPMLAWSKVKTHLSDLDTTRLHYILPKDPNWTKKLIMIDFDIRNADGEKDMRLNLEAASRWPRTYAEFSKGGGGIHLIYWYDGDILKLKPVFEPGIEVKVFNGNASMRRRLTKCNNIPIETLKSGLPIKEDKVISVKAIKSQRKLVDVIKDCLNKRHHGATKPEIDFLVKILDDAYASGLTYDVSDLHHDILMFAMHSSHNAAYCKKQVKRMKFRSDDPIEDKTLQKDDISDELVFFDIEVFPNLLLVNWKFAGEGKPVMRMINPSPHDIEELFKYKLVGFNCRKYDNHILYGRYLGLSVEELYDLSQRIIVESAKDAFYPEAYNVSYTDVYDFSSKKQSLKKFEIELGIHHQELGLPWDQPVPESMWDKVAEYCDNDVIATEATFNARKADFTARQILAALAGMTVNDTTNTLTTRIIFGGERKPQHDFNYRDMGDISKGVEGLPFDSPLQNSDLDWDYTMFDEKGRPIFPGYSYSFGKSIYRDEEVGEGGYVYAETGIHCNVALLDIASMHPSSVVAEQLFGPVYTQKFQDILNARIAIKHKDFDTARKLMDGKLAPFLDDENVAKDLAQALKIAINSVYGLTSARFENPFRDKRNIDNIVAKRGALFMVNLKHEVQRRGFTVAHIKTDSIKIPNATPDIIKFVMDYGKLYGYNFEHEATYDRMCLVNDAVYIAKYATEDWCSDAYGYSPGDNAKHGGEWTATGAQFQQPYVFKTLFSGEPIAFSDMCETKSVTGGAIYLDMNEALPDVEDAEHELEKLYKKSDISAVLVDQVRRGVVDIESLNSDQGLSVEHAMELQDYISKGHDYHFVGRAGLFCPIKPSYGGGVMYREKDGKYYAVTGTKGFRWLEAEMVTALNKEADVDIRYHDMLVTEAVSSISEYGDFDAFIDEAPYISKKVEEVPPFDLVPCGDGKYNTCMECPNLVDGDICRRGYSLASYIENGGK